MNHRNAKDATMSQEGLEDGSNDIDKIDDNEGAGIATEINDAGDTVSGLPVINASARKDLEHLEDVVSSKNIVSKGAKNELDHLEDVVITKMPVSAGGDHSEAKSKIPGKAVASKSPQIAVTAAPSEIQNELGLERNVEPWSPPMPMPLPQRGAHIYQENTQPGAFAVGGPAPFTRNNRAQPHFLLTHAPESNPLPEPGAEAPIATASTGLAVAAPVLAPDERNLPTAEEWDREDQGAPDRRNCMQRRKKINAVTLVLLFGCPCCLGLVIFGVLYSMKDCNCNQSAPTTLFASPEDYLMSLLPNHTLDRMQSPTSPQWKAYEWLAGDAFQYSDWRLLQRFALATLFFATGGSDGHWYNTSQWLSDAHECDWHSGPPGGALLKTYKDGDLYPNNGTVCEDSSISQDRHYGSLWLNQNGLEGSLPDEIFLLTSLRVLAPYGNKISGTISSLVGNLHNLEAFAMGLNELSGTVPSELLSIPNLTLALMSGNHITGTLPSEVGNVRSSMRYLWFDNNRMSGYLPTELALLSEMESLILHKNRLSMSIPSELGRLSSSLIQFWLYDNFLTGSLPSELGRLSRLELLTISGNLITGHLPSELGFLQNLGYLIMHDNMLQHFIPSELGSLTRLRQLRFQNNSMSGFLPSELYLLRSLEQLYLQDNFFSGTLATEMGLMGNLTSLSLFQNAFSSTIPSEFGSMVNLTHLLLQENHLSGDIPKELAILQNKSLVAMNVSSNDIVGEIPAELCLLDQSFLSFDCSESLCGCWCKCATRRK